MVATFTTVVPDELAGLRLDKFLVSQFADKSRSQLAQWIKLQLVTVNGKARATKYMVQPGDVVLVSPPPDKPVDVVPESMALNIVYDDEHIVVVDKPAGVVVHPGAGHASGTLLNGLLGRYKQLSSIGAPTRPGVVHRIDAGTSGLLVFAKNDESHMALSEQFSAHTVERTYLALIWGHGADEKGTIESLYGRAPNHRIKFSSMVKKGKRAVTHWRRIADLGPCRLIRLQLETGRTHQIRVHMSDLGFPLVGDPLYGRKRRVEHIPKLRSRGVELGLNRQALHAQTLGFLHPITGQTIRFTSQVPADITSLILDLGGTEDLLSIDARALT